MIYINRVEGEWNSFCPFFQVVLCLSLRFCFFDSLDSRLLGEKPICINLANRKSI